MAKRTLRGTQIDCRYQGKAMTHGQIEYVVWCMLTAALDMIEDGAPAGSITLKERTKWLDPRPVTDLSSYERGALEGAGMALSIFYCAVRRRRNGRGRRFGGGGRLRRRM